MTFGSCLLSLVWVLAAALDSGALKLERASRVNSFVWFNLVVVWFKSGRGRVLYMCGFSHSAFFPGPLIRDALIDPPFTSILNFFRQAPSAKPQNRLRRKFDSPE